MKKLLFLSFGLVLAFFATAQKSPFRPTPQTIEAEEFIGTPREEMPRYPACDSVKNEDERRECANKALLNFIYSNLRYPNDACIEGIVVVRFTVEEDGTLTDFQILRDIGGGAGEEALRVVKMLPKFVPSKQNGKAVRCPFNLPIRFRLH